MVVNNYFVLNYLTTERGSNEPRKHIFLKEREGEILVFAE